MPGDIDDDLLPDAAFVGLRGEGEVVLNVTSKPTKVGLRRIVSAVDIGYPPGMLDPQVIIAQKTQKFFKWSWLDLMTDRTTRFATVSGRGKPVVGCYINNRYTASAFIRSKTSAQLIAYLARGDYVVNVPKSTQSARCGPPLGGTSSVYYMQYDKRRKTYTLYGKNGARQILASPRLDRRVRTPIFGIIPREPLQRPTLWVLARVGKSQELRVLDRFNKWIKLSLPRVPVGSRIASIVAVQNETRTFFVFQMTNRKRETSYVSVPIAADLL